MPVWENQINGAYVRDILKHPEETYSTRLRNEGILYDFAAVARQDAPGLLITYIKKEEISQENGDLTMDTLFAGFHFQMDRLSAFRQPGVVRKQAEHKRIRALCIHSFRSGIYGTQCGLRRLRAACGFALYVFCPL